MGLPGALGRSGACEAIPARARMGARRGHVAVAMAVRRLLAITFAAALVTTAVRFPIVAGGYWQYWQLRWRWPAPSGR